MKLTLSHLPRQRGMALIAGLIFLVILTVLGVTAMQTTTLEERIAGNTRDRNVAFQAGEVTLRDAERDIMSKRVGTPTAPRALPISGRTGFDASCTYGLCYSGRPDGYFYSGGSYKAAWNAFSLSATPSVPYGTYTGAANLQGLAAQPRYLIEVFRKWPPGSSSWRHYYRITTLAVGANSNTQVTLQEVFAP